MSRVDIEPAFSSNSEPPIFVVGIGASAGGLEAIEQFFDRMPTDSGMSFAVVQHLSPDYKSLMNEVLARWTTMPILQVEDGMQVERDSIYLLPPKKEMIISGGRLLLTDKDPTGALSLPIDHFFRSLGQDCGQKAIAVVLSGTGSDGSRGIVDVHEAGGLVIAQSAKSAKFDGMPRTAEGTGLVDLVLPPTEMPNALQRYASDPRILASPAPLDNHSLDDSGLNKIFTLIRDTYGIDFSHYKLSTVIRRTERRLVLHKAQNIDEYVQLLLSDSQELSQLYRDLLIGVTKFFRDADAFDKVSETILKSLIEQAEDGSELRVWVAGCASGEEAYTLAIQIDEAIVESGKQLHLKLFATDAHRDSLEFAGLGVYPEAAMGDISPQRLERYFKPVKGGYQTASYLRQKIVFAPHNLIKDAPFTKLDFISCRNLLIYLQPYAQQKVLSLFHFALRTGGGLLLGPSESLGAIAAEFEPIDTRWKIFRKRQDSRLPSDIRQKLSVEFEKLSRKAKQMAKSREPSPSDLQAMSMYDALLVTVLPPSLLISEEGELLHTFGNAGQFLLPEQGRHSIYLRDRIIPGLHAPAITAIGKTLKDEEEVTYSGIPIHLEGEERPPTIYEVSTRLVRDPRRMVRSVLVQIREVVSATQAPRLRHEPDSFSDEQIITLESELRYTKENLQAAIEELETSNEELQSSNEELIASNEELQSTNEELHSVNEELHAVNAEHQNKIIQLSELTRDMDSLLDSTEIDTMFLDTDLRIRKYTPGVARRFNFLPQDLGRKIGSFTHTIQSEAIADKIQSVVHSGKSYEEEVRDKTGDYFLMRILPYFTSHDKGEPQIEGVLLTLIDITKLKNTSNALAESVQQRDTFLAMLSHELRNPLATILNAVHLTLSDNKTLSDASPIEVIKRQSLQMSALLDDLLDVTRVSQGKTQIQRRPIDLLLVIERAFESVAPQIEARSQALLAQLVDEPVWVFGSEPRILQVLANLLTNASKYSAVGDEIEFTLDIENNIAIMHVIDHGVGISPQQIDKVFDLFVQADRTLDRADGGLGVGLTLVKSLVELHGGEVSVESMGEGRGSSFCVTLPCCDPPPPASSSSEQPASSQKIQRLALIEDNLDASKMLAYLLEDAGYQVSVAHDGKSGLDLIRQTLPDAAIVDVGLPEMDGYAVARAIRQEQKYDEIVLIAVTGYGQAKDREEAELAGFDEHLVKPVDPELLNRLLLEFPLRRRTQQVELYDS